MAIHPIRASDRALGFKIRQEGKLKLAVASKGEMTPGTVNRDSDQSGIEVPKLGEQLVVQRHLVAAYRTPIGRVKGQNDRLASEFPQGDTLVGRAVQAKVGASVPGARTAVGA
jgi:hypothetical protein